MGGERDNPKKKQEAEDNAATVRLVEFGDDDLLRPEDDFVLLSKDSPITMTSDQSAVPKNTAAAAGGAAPFTPGAFEAVT